MPHYIDNKRFEFLIKTYLEGDKDQEEELIGLFDLLIVNIMDSFHFKVDREDAKQECFLLILKTLNNFDPNHGSAFNYFTTIIVNNLKLIYSKNKKYLDKISLYIETKFGYNPSAW